VSRTGPAVQNSRSSGLSQRSLDSLAARLIACSAAGFICNFNREYFLDTSDRPDGGAA
jgi:hypothetical protein